MKYKIAALLMVSLLAISCGKKKNQGLLFLLPSLSTPSLTNTIETPVADVSPTPDTFQHPVVSEPTGSTGTGTGSTDTTGSTGTGTGSTDTTGSTGTGTGSTDTTGSTGTGTGSTDTTGSTGTGTGSTDTTGSTGTGTGSTDTTGSTGTGTGSGSSTGSSGLAGSNANPDVAVAHITESEFKVDGIAMTDCVKALKIPSPTGNKVVYEDLSNNICQVQGVWFVVIPWDFKDGNFKMHVDRKIPGAKYLLSALYGTYDVDGYRDLMYPQRFATAPYTPVYNVDYTTLNWLITSQDVFLIDIPKHAWVNFNRNYAFFRIFVGEKDVTNLYGYKKTDLDHGERYNGKDRDDDHKTASRESDDDRDHRGSSKDSDEEHGYGEYQNGTTIRLTVSHQTYAIDPPPSTISAYLLQSGGIRTSVQTAGLATLALGLVGLIVYLARKRQAA